MRAFLSCQSGCAALRMDTGEKKSFGCMNVAYPRNAFLIHEKDLDRTRGLLEKLVQAGRCELSLERFHSKRFEALCFLVGDEAKLPETPHVEKRETLAA